ncbi:HrgA protein [Helicobacter heilmannii]|uniref:HrgA protein n=1 Tax=Helicobacter TaxID=209 RepID=UPI0006A07F4C|nr:MULTISPECIES: HrgA protein [Helicobacter]GMB91009.1 Putative HrgA like protein [Helicobacter ailurogastricus]CRF48650.1 HrgA protein [Helicobacter heilmannii]
MKPDYLEIVLEVLKEAKTPVSIYDLYAKAQELKEAGKINKAFSTVERLTYLPVYKALKEGETLPFVQVANYPITIALKEYAPNALEVQATSQTSSKTERHHERLLHPLLAHFAHHKWGAHTKTIEHEKALKAPKGKHSWLYPDIVGASFAYKNFEPTLRKFVENFDNLPLKLLSFEMKKEVNLSNCREYYFQAISNSSWAHEGYLVAEKINTQDNDLMDLLKRLHASFGIGVVLLNIADTSKSQVLLNARFKDNLDHAMLGELSKNSPDFQEFLKALSLYHEAIKAHMSEQTNLQAFDRVFDKGALQTYIDVEILGHTPKEV